MTSFNIAFQSGKKKTCWIKCVTFHKLAEICAQYLHKGARIAISGILDQNKWTTDDGQNRSTFQIIGNTSSSSRQTAGDSRKGKHPRKHQ